MRLNEAFPDWLTDGIFTRLATLFSARLPWVDDNKTELDLMYHGNRSGDKETSPLIDKLADISGGTLTTEQISSLARVIYAKYGEQWQKLHRVLEVEYDPIENYSMVEEETPDITRTETPDISRSRTTTAQTDYTVSTESDTNADVYGFNSTSPVPQGESGGTSSVTTKGDADKNISTETDTETGTRTQTETGKRTLTRSGNIGVTTSQQMLESEIALWEWNFFETVFNDVDMVLTTPKYNI